MEMGGFRQNYSFGGPGWIWMDEMGSTWQWVPGGMLAQISDEIQGLRETSAYMRSVLEVVKESVKDIKEELGDVKRQMNDASKVLGHLSEAFYNSLNDTSLEDCDVSAADEGDVQGSGEGGGMGDGSHVVFGIANADYVVGGTKSRDRRVKDVSLVETCGSGTQDNSFMSQESYSVSGFAHPQVSGSWAQTAVCENQPHEMQATPGYYVQPLDPGNFVQPACGYQEQLGVYETPSHTDYGFPLRHNEFQGQSKIHRSPSYLGYRNQGQVEGNRTQEVYGAPLHVSYGNERQPGAYGTPVQLDYGSAQHGYGQWVGPGGSCVGYQH